MFLNFFSVDPRNRSSRNKHGMCALLVNLCRQETQVGQQEQEKERDTKTKTWCVAFAILVISTYLFLGGQAKKTGIVKNLGNLQNYHFQSFSFPWHLKENGRRWAEFQHWQPQKELSPIWILNKSWQIDLYMNLSLASRWQTSFMAVKLAQPQILHFNPLKETLWTARGHPPAQHRPCSWWLIRCLRGRSCPTSRPTAHIEHELSFAHLNV